MSALRNSPTAMPMAIWTMEAATLKTTALMVFCCSRMRASVAAASGAVLFSLVNRSAVDSPLSRPPVEARPPGTWVKMEGMRVAAATLCRSRESILANKPTHRALRVLAICGLAESLRLL